MIHYNKWGHFFGSELNRFVNLSIQATLLDRILNSWPFQFENSKAPFIDISSKIIPNEILENPYFLRNYKDNPDEMKIYGPDIIKIVCHGPNNSYLKIFTKQGFVEYSWHITYMQTPYYSKYFIKGLMENQELANDIKIVIDMKYKVNKWNAFSKKTKKLIDWFNYLENRLDEFDWHNKDIQRMITIIK